MSDAMIWLIPSIVLIVLEFVIPGGIVIFLGLAGTIVAAGIHWGLINSTVTALMVWFILSIVMLFILRSIFIKYFEGKSMVQDVDEDRDLEDSLVEVVEDIFPYQGGRVRFRDSTWEARSDDEVLNGQKAIIVSRDGNKLIVKKV